MYIYITVTVIMAISLNALLEIKQRLKREREKNVSLLEKYQPIADKESQLRRTEDEYSNLKSEYREQLTNLKSSEIFLKSYNIGIGTTDDSLYVTKTKPTKKNLDKISKELKLVKTEIKNLLSRKMACICEYHGKGITYGTSERNSMAQATKLFNREIKLRLRCLDNEFKMAHALIDWHNVNRLISRCETACNEINQSGVYLKTTIQPEYLELKVRELKLSFEIDRIKSDIKEKARAELQVLRQAEREEARLKVATKKAVEEREKMDKLVSQEMRKYVSGTKEQKSLLEEHKRILEVLRAKEIRALSMAQQTRAGFIYVITNKNSFAQGMCKIGMTRRLDPYDRVKELGDASVPALFDVHAFAYSEDAPKLEKILHEKFADARVNLVNKRKEFFKVEPSKVLDYLLNYGKGIDLQLFE